MTTGVRPVGGKTTVTVTVTRTVTVIKTATATATVTETEMTARTVIVIGISNVKSHFVEIDPWPITIQYYIVN